MPDGRWRRVSRAKEATALPPRALIVTMYGLYARESDGWLSVAALVKLMAQLGVDEPAVRSAISRLKRRSVITPERVDGSAGYTIGEHTRRMLELGDRRIFDRKQAALSDGWLLAVFSVPEAERDKRHLLRSRLAWLGFGTVSSGIWIAPRHLEDEAREVLAGAGFGPYVELFRADHLGFGAVTDKIAGWWDLAELDALYSEFERINSRRPCGVASAAPDRGRRSVRRLHPRTDGLAPPALPRSRPARRTAAGRLVGHARRGDLRRDARPPRRAGPPLRRRRPGLRISRPDIASGIVAAETTLHPASSPGSQILSARTTMPGAKGRPVFFRTVKPS